MRKNYTISPKGAIFFTHLDSNKKNKNHMTDNRNTIILNSNIENKNNEENNPKPKIENFPNIFTRTLTIIFNSKLINFQLPQANI